MRPWHDRFCLVAILLLACSHGNTALETSPFVTREQVDPSKKAPPTPDGRETGISRPPYHERWYNGAVFYEVMVRSFQDSDGDGIGDLRGLISRLDYLNTGRPDSTEDLKVDALWLMPLFKSPSYHGYDATDYYQIDPVYGSLADFRELIDQAHRRGIRVILDLVLNHTSQQHPWFQRAGRSNAPSERDWYVWGSEDPGWERPWGGGPVWHQRGSVYYYGLFWMGMPDLNFRHPPVQEEMLKISNYWLHMGADGYRLDAIRYLFEEGRGRQADLPETHVFLQRLARHAHEVRPEAVLVGEIWSKPADIATYFGEGKELDLAFGFTEAAGLVEALRTNTAAPLEKALEELRETLPEPQFTAPFLTNHDMPRLASLLGPDPRKSALAASILLSLPGTPFLYQGEEIGLENGPRPGDEGKRSPMQWDSTAGAGFSSGNAWNPLSGGQEHRSVSVQLAQADSLLSTYRQVIRLRTSSPALRHGSLQHLSSESETEGETFTFLRQHLSDRVVCHINFSDSAAPASSVLLQLPASQGVALKARDLLSKVPLGLEVASPDSWKLHVPEVAPHSMVWIEVDSF